jgi:site-specific recombinase XerD
VLASGRFFAWCEDRGLTLTVIRSHDVATWVEELQEKHGAPGVKQQLAAVRMLFDWLIIGQVVPTKPGRRRPRPEICGDDRQDAGAGRQ